MAKEKKGGRVELLPKDVEKPEVPRPFRVVIHNDDYTPKSFVVWLLQEVFHHGSERARSIMWTAHETGYSVAGVFSREVAEAKVARCIDFAKEHEHPLNITMEPDEI